MKTDFSQPLELCIDTSVLKGKTAIIQDAATGLGLGIATTLAEHGAKVAICGSDAKAGDAAVKDLENRGCSVSYFKTDTSDWNSLLSTFKQVITWSEQQLDIVVTSAGIVTHNMLMSVLPSNHRAGADPPKPPTNTIEVNLLGVYYTTSLALWYFNQLSPKRLDPTFDPQLLFICSMAGVSVPWFPFLSVYLAVLTTVRVLVRRLRVRHRLCGLQACCTSHLEDHSAPTTDYGTIPVKSTRAHLRQQKENRWRI